MTAIKISLSTAFGLYLCVISAFARDEILPYTQSYVIEIKGERAGNESVFEKRGSDGELISTSEHEIFVTDGMQNKRMAFTTRMVFPKGSLNPSSYSYRYKTEGTEAGDSYDVTVKDGQVTRVLNRGGRSSEATVPFLPTMVILDVNVYHQYDYLIRRYDLKKGGRQLFADFVPVIGNDIPLAVTYQGNEILKLNKDELAIQNFQIEFVGIWTASVSVDKNGHLVRMISPAQDLKVIRKDLVQ